MSSLWWGSTNDQAMLRHSSVWLRQEQGSTWRPSDVSGYFEVHRLATHAGYPMSPTRHQHATGGLGLDDFKEYEYIHSSRPFV